MLDRIGFSDERTLMMATTDGEMMDEMMRPVIDDDLVDRLMDQVDAEGLELLGPDGDLDRVDISDPVSWPRGRDG